MAFNSQIQHTTDRGEPKLYVRVSEVEGWYVTLSRKKHKRRADESICSVSFYWKCAKCNKEVAATSVVVPETPSVMELNNVMPLLPEAPLCVHPLSSDGQSFPGDCLVSYVKYVNEREGSLGSLTSEDKCWLSNQVRGTSIIAKTRSQGTAVQSSSMKGSEVESRGLDDSIVPLITPPSLHARTKQWVVFSDLHVKPTSIETCEEVLSCVHEEAVKRDAGIIFLGDFWHVRGSLNVDLLNRVMKALEKWTQPVIMIPGNHDQVNLGGSIHALEPLMYAFSPGQALLINDPAVCMGALWLPYRRDNKLLQRILEATPSDVSMIFCHADVRGAFMNDGIRCKEGLEVDSFPKNMPIFSGHFHKPHTLSKNSVNVRYVGSPYQTSLSEADQQKFMYLLSSAPGAAGSGRQHEWKELGRWPINFGRKYFRAAGLLDSKLAMALAGDKVVLSVSISEKDQADTLAQLMRQRGIEIELRAEEISIDKPMSVRGVDASPSMADSDTGVVRAAEAGIQQSPVWHVQQKDAHTLFEEYVLALNLESMPAPASKQARRGQEEIQMSDEDLKQHKITLTKAGHRLLSELLEAYPKLHHNVANEPKDLSLSSVQLTNFGPYGGDPVLYPLGQRGLVLIRGVVEDDTGADSNGSGKTTLAMSVMWCLTGSLDARLIADSKAADVTYDSFVTDSAVKSRRVASVELKGQINGKDFVVSRKKGSRKTELSFMLGGKDMTTLSIKETQTMINEHLGIGNNLLARCCFYGQHSHTQQSLLGLQDTGLKYELGRLVDVTVWIEAAKMVRSKEKLNEEQLREINFGIRTNQEEFNKATHKKIEANKNLQSRHTELAKHSDDLGRLKLDYDAVTRQFNETEQSLAAKEQQRQAWQKNTVEPARQSLLAFLNRATDKGVEQQQSLVRIDLQRIKTLIDGVKQELNKIQYEMHDVVSSVDTGHSRLKSLTVALHGDSDSTSSEFSLSLLPTQLLDLRTELESQLGQLGSLEAMIQSTNATYTKLRKLCADITHAVHEGAAGAIRAPSDDLLDQCPTCGQELPEEDRQARIATCEQELQELSANRRLVYTEVTATKQKISRAEYVVHTLTSLEELTKTKETLETRVKQLSESLQSHQKSESELEGQLKQLSLKQANNEKVYEQEKLALHSALADAESHMRLLDSSIAAISSQLEDLRRKKAICRNETQRATSAVSVLKNSLHYAQKEFSEKEEQVKQLQAALDAGVRTKSELMQQSTINEQLVGLFGPKGIQNYIFSTALVQLESLSNDYLQVFTEGGMQLSLRSDEEGEKIIKTVMMKHANADGVFYKERTLSLLSGGQWRRVSLALDLAFTDMIRKQGKLRCNLLVMDEVLSHLDAQGRGAVGSILRALASPSRYRALTDSSASSFSGVDVLDTQDVVEKMPTALRHDHLSLIEMDPYDTILVILQDMAAAEMEESFDHIDVVTKRDFSTVKVDGLH